jgi:transcriptional regulator with XRE-family HTH domain
MEVRGDHAAQRGTGRGAGVHCADPLHRSSGSLVAPSWPCPMPPPTPRAQTTAVSSSQPTGLLTVTEAAQQAGVSRWTIAGWIDWGYLPSLLIDRRRFVRAADLAAAQTHRHLDGVVPAWRRDRQRAGWRLRQVREAAGLTQLEVAAIAGITHEAISLLETGRRAPMVATVRRLAQALRVAPRVFVADDDLAAVGLTTVAAAARLGVPPARVQTWLATGKLPGVKVSGQWRVPVLAVTELEARKRLRGRSRRLDPRFRG